MSKHEILYIDYIAGGDTLCYLDGVEIIAEDFSHGDNAPMPIARRLAKALRTPVYHVELEKSEVHDLLAESTTEPVGLARGTSAIWWVPPGR